MRIVGRRVGVAVVCAVGLATAGCGSSSSGADADKAAPLKIMVQGVFSGDGLDLRQIPGGAQAAAKAINAAGGIHGRTIEVIPCDEGRNPNAGVRCARKAVSEGVVAEVGPHSNNGDYLSVLEGAGIPAIATVGRSPNELASDIAFPISGEVPTLYAALGALLGAQGARRVTAVTLNSPATVAAIPLVQKGLSPYGAKLVGKVTTPPGAADLAPVVASSLAHGADGAATVLDPAGMAKYVTEAAKQKANLKIAANPISFPPSAIKSVGKAGNGVLVVSWFKPSTLTSDPDVQKFNREMDAFDPQLPKDDAAANSWAGVYLFAHVAKKISADNITSKAIVEQLRQVDGLDLGVAPPIQFKRPVTAFGPDIKRLFTTKVMYNRVEKGQIVSLNGRFSDPLAGG